MLTVVNSGFTPYSPARLFIKRRHTTTADTTAAKLARCSPQGPLAQQVGIGDVMLDDQCRSTAAEQLSAVIEGHLCQPNGEDASKATPSTPAGPLVKMATFPAVHGFVWAVESISPCVASPFELVANCVIGH